MAKLVPKISGAVAIGVFTIVGLVVGASEGAHAHDGHDHVAVLAAEANTDKSKTYSYTANTGDAYAQMVRKAVQTYGIENNKNIGNALIVAIETKASEQAGWPVLSEGQVVSFSESLIKTWVDEAMKLSVADVAAWQTYVQYVDFDTKNIGE